MMNYEDPDHDGNSSKWHTGKQCVEKGCRKPAGTWWSPVWCFDHNVERMKRVTAAMDDAAKRAEIAALIDKETASLRNWAFEMSRTIKAMVLASGGTLVIKNADKDRKITSESVQYGKDTTTYNYQPQP
jgi:hypothetical protein